MICVSTHRICQAVVADIDQNVKIHTTDRLINHTFGFPGTKTWYMSIYEIRISLISTEYYIIHEFVSIFMTPCSDEMIDFLSHRLAGGGERP